MAPSGGDEARVGLLIALLWIAWLIYWLAAARSVKPVRRRESRLLRVLWHLPLVAGAVVLATPIAKGTWLSAHFVPGGRSVAAIAVALVALGLGLAVWARRHLADNWSGEVALKHGHELIETGPFRAIRHPIYAGVLLALIGTTLAVGEWRALIGFCLLLLGFLRRVWLEERWLTEAFGPEYARYRTRSKALIPFLF